MDQQAKLSTQPERSFGFLKLVFVLLVCGAGIYLSYKWREAKQARQQYEAEVYELSCFEDIRSHEYIAALLDAESAPDFSKISFYRGLQHYLDYQSIRPIYTETLKAHVFIPDSSEVAFADFCAFLHKHNPKVPYDDILDCATFTFQSLNGRLEKVDKKSAELLFFHKVPLASAMGLVLSAAKTDQGHEALRKYIEVISSDGPTNATPQARQQAEANARGLAEQQAQAQEEARRKPALIRAATMARNQATNARRRVEELEEKLAQATGASEKARKQAGGLKYEAERAKLQFDNKARLEAKAQNLVNSLSSQRAGNPRQDAQLAGQLEEAIRQRDRATTEANAAEAALRKVLAEHEKILQETKRAEAAIKFSNEELPRARQAAEESETTAKAAETAAGMSPEQAAIPKPPPAPPQQD